MAKGISIRKSDEFETPAIAFLKVMALEVDVALKDAGITEKKKRREIVDSFCFGMGNFLDQYWFEADGKRYFPIVSYSLKHAQDGPKESGMPERFDYHEYAGGMFDALTEDKRVPYTIQIGLVGRDEPLDPKSF